MPRPRDDLLSALPTDDEEIELPSWSRTLCGYHERFARPYVLSVDPESRTLSLMQSHTASSAHAAEASGSADGLVTGCTVWDAGIVLSAYLLQQPAVEACARGGHVLELGCGTGIVGLGAALTAAFTTVVLTDMASVLELTRENVRRNCAVLPDETKVVVEALHWDTAEARRCAVRHGPFDLVVGGDLLYRLPVVQPLLEALSQVVSEATVVLIAASAQHSPETVRRFVMDSQRVGFDVRILHMDEQHAAYRSAEVRLLRLTRRPAGCSTKKKKKKRKREFAGGQQEES